MESHYINLANLIFYFSSSLLATKNLQNQFFLEILILDFAFWRDFAKEKTAAQTTCPPVRASSQHSMRCRAVRILAFEDRLRFFGTKVCDEIFCSSSRFAHHAMRRHFSEKPTTFFFRFYFVIFGCRSSFSQAFELWCHTRILHLLPKSPCTWYLREKMFPERKLLRS